MARLTKEQLANRRKGIGSSDVATILGISPYAGHNSTALILDKRGLIALPDDEEPEEEIQFYLGHELEKVCAAAYARDQGVTLEVTGTVQSTIHDWAFATLDRRVTGQDRLVECKAVGQWMTWDREAHVKRWDKSDPFGIPYDVLVQRHWQSWCAGVEENDVAAILTGTDFAIFRTPYDRELADRLVEECGLWWEKYMVKGDDPEPDGSSASREYLKLKYPKAGPPLLLDANPAQNVLGRGYLEITKSMGVAKEEKERIAQLMINEIADRCVGFKGDGWKCTYKPDRNGKRSLRVTAMGDKDAPVDE